jgi:hypothetical protein
METYGFTPKELKILKNLRTPAKIQDFIDSLPYDYEENICRSPRTVLRLRKINCFSGAIFAAAALRICGFKPLIIDLCATRDEDHILAVFQIGGLWGAVAKSKFVGLRFRDPVFKSIRELVLSYFEFYYNYAHQKTLREYSNPVDLSALDKYNWMTNEQSIGFVNEYLDTRPHFKIILKKMEKKLRTVDKISFARGIIERKKS